MENIEEVKSEDVSLKEFVNRKPYQGFTREILVEHFVERGFPFPYEILDDSGQAYVLTSNNEAFATPFEGKVAFPNFFRIASFPVIKKEDLFFTSYTEEDIKDFAKEAILKQEDGRLLTLLASAIEEGNVDCLLEVEVFTKDSFEKLVGRIKNNGIDIKNVLINPEDVGELSWLDKEKYNLIESSTIPVGNIYLTPVKEKLGVMPNAYGLDIEESRKPEQFQLGWVLDETIGMLILNPKGLGRIKKTGL